LRGGCNRRQWPNAGILTRSGVGSDQRGWRPSSVVDIPIHVPSHERHLFDPVEIFWTAKQPYDADHVRNNYSMNDGPQRKLRPLAPALRQIIA